MNTVNVFWGLGPVLILPRWSNGNSLIKNWVRTVFSSSWWFILASDKWSCQMIVAEVCRVQGYNLVSSWLQNLLFTDPACLTVPPSIILLNASKEDIVRKVLIRSKTNHLIKLQISRPSESIFRKKFGWVEFWLMPFSACIRSSLLYTLMTITKE